MVRQRQQQRKSVEELYATKFEANPTKSAVSSSNNTKNVRNTERDYNGGYIITSSTPYNASQTCGAASLATGRRKTARQSSQPVKPEKFFSKDEKVLNLDEVKKDTNVKVKTSRNEKCPYSSAQNMYDNKSFVNFSENLHHKDSTHRNHNHNNHSNHHHHDDDKDDDTEEFFELIRQTVETAIGKSISDLLNRNFRELSAKIDRFSAELKATNSNLNKLQTEINNKVVHYGEENSRHFRYLCMKSEYDKMFYQHHTMMASNTQVPEKNNPQSPPPHPEQQTRQRMNNVPKTHSKSDCDKSTNPCTCRSAKMPPPSCDPHKTSSEEHTGISNKSSEMGMREVLEHIQRFCNQMQLNDFKGDDRMPKNGFRIEDAMKINKQVFEDDDDDFQMSSDGMTPRSDEHLPQHKYGGATMRSCNTTRGGNGGGDA